MQVTVEIPDYLVQQFVAAGQNPARALLEDSLAQNYRAGRITSRQLMEVLGIETRYELDGFLKDHQIWIEYTPEQMDADDRFQDRFVPNHTQR